MFSLAPKVGVSWKQLMRRTDQCVVNQFMHCHLFAEGAKVLTRKADERMAAMIAKALKKAASCQDLK